MNKVVEIGSIVRVEARGSRSTDGEPRLIPAIVLSQHEDGSLQLFCFHFEGQYLANAVPLDQCEIVIDAKAVQSMVGMGMVDNMQMAKMAPRPVPVKPMLGEKVLHE